MTSEVKFILGALAFAGIAAAGAIALDRKNIGHGPGGAGPGAGAGAAAEAPFDPNAAKQGQALYTSLGCIACHSTDGSMRVGPTFAGLYGKTEKITGGDQVKVDHTYLVESIKDPTAKVVAGYVPTMPAFPAMQQAEVDALIMYIRSLK